MTSEPTVLLTLTGRDRPGVTAAVLVPLSVLSVWILGGRIEPVRKPGSSETN